MTLGSWTLILHATRLCLEEIITILCPFYFKAAYQRHNSIEIDENKKTPEQKYFGVEFKFFPAD